MSIFNTLREAKNLKTYEVGLLQTRVYRNFKQKTALSLKPYGISSTEWAFLGVLHEHPNGIRSTDLAEVLGVEVPFITSLTPKFEKEKILQYNLDHADKRAKKITLTEKGHNLVLDIEKVLRADSKKWLVGLSISEVLTFIKVLKKLSRE